MHSGQPVGIGYRIGRDDVGHDGCDTFILFYTFTLYFFLYLYLYFLSFQKKKKLLQENEKV